MNLETFTCHLLEPLQPFNTPSITITNQQEPVNVVFFFFLLYLLHMSNGLMDWCLKCYSVVGLWNPSAFVRIRWNFLPDTKADGDRTRARARWKEDEKRSLSDSLWFHSSWCLHRVWKSPTRTDPCLFKLGASRPFTPRGASFILHRFVSDSSVPII